MSGAGGLDGLFRPRSIAVVGASAAPGKMGHALVRALHAFPGPVHAVNPRLDAPVAGRPHAASVAGVPAPLDLALLCLPAPALPGAIGDCVAAGVRAAVVCSGGLGESGEEGRRIERELTHIARDGGLRLLGPNTSGFLDPAQALCASFVPDADRVAAGSVAVVAQSGGVNHALAWMLHDAGIGVSLAVGLGNAVDVDATALLDHLAGDERTRAIVLHLEGIGDGRALVEAIERTVPCKPVVALKVGRADVGAFAQSHTGRLLGSWRLARAALRQAGAVVVEDTGALVDAARALRLARLAASAGGGVGLVTGQAGPGLLIADALRAAGVELPQLAAATRARLGELLPPITYQANPVDTGRPGPEFADVLAAVARDPAVALVGAYALHEPTALDAPGALRAAAEAAQVPVVFGTGGPAAAVAAVRAELEPLGVPVYVTPEGCARGLRALAEDAAGCARLGERGADGGTQLALPDGPLDEAQAKRALAALGIAMPRSAVCATRAEASAAFERLGPPVVVKVLHAGIQHKTEAGGVHVGVATTERLDAALDAIDAMAPAGARYLVEEQVPPGPELIVGATRDASFGPTVLVGLGGVAAEAFADVAVGTAPLGEADALRLLGELRGQPLLDGLRGAPPVDRVALARLVVALGRFAAAQPHVAEVELNPVRWVEGRLVALDALIVRVPALDAAPATA